VRAVTVRTVALTVVALILVAAMVLLGRWQYTAYSERQDSDAAAALDRAPIPLDQALGADEAFPSDSVSRPVTVTGTYRPAEQFYVRGLGGVGRYGVATPVETDSGAAVIVIRGSADTVPAPAASGRVRVTGVLEPSESIAAPLDRRRITNGVQIARLVPDFEEDLYAGYVLATASVPPDPLAPVAPPRPDASFWAGIRNLVYAVQWWLFAAFVVLMWWRIVRDESGADHLAQEPPADPPSNDPADAPIAVARRGPDDSGG
jgi:surfeit locus 1 family protein